MRGALVSEYAPGTKPYGSFFRARNRITSGLALGVAVIEAPLKSGTRLFVNEAAGSGARRYSPFRKCRSAKLRGNEPSDKEGAKPVTNGWEVVSEFAALLSRKG